MWGHPPTIWSSSPGMRAAATADALAREEAADAAVTASLRAKVFSTISLRKIDTLAAAGWRSRQEGWSAGARVSGGRSGLARFVGARQVVGLRRRVRGGQPGLPLVAGVRGRWLVCGCVSKQIAR